MQSLQEVFNHTLQVKKDQKTVKAILRDALANSQSYKEVNEKLQAIKEEKKKIESAIRDELRSELAKLDEIKTELESDKTIMSDLAINEMIKGNLIEIVDQYSNKYEPLFSVRFKKI